MPQDDLYWNPEDVDSDDSLPPPPAKEPYVDPWDLENYAYIRDHLESMELSSNPSSLPVSGSSSGDFAEVNSTSFYYVPGSARRPPHPSADRLRGYDAACCESLVESGNYAAIDEVNLYAGRTRPEYVPYEGVRSRERRRTILEDVETDLDESSFDDGPLRENSVFGIYDKTGHLRKVAVPVLPVGAPKTRRDRSMSYSYGDYDYDPYASRQEIYSRLDDLPRRSHSPIPIYDDVRRLRSKPNNFGLSNYGHLKIDYSYSWNNLNKYIKYN